MLAELANTMCIEDLKNDVNECELQRDFNDISCTKRESNVKKTGVESVDT